MAVKVNVTENLTRISVTVKEFAGGINLSAIQFETLEDGTKGINLDWLREALGSAPVETVNLIFDIPDIPEQIPVLVNGVVLVNRQKTYLKGQVLPELVLSAEGYNITPPKVEAGLVMDATKTLEFEASLVTAGRQFIIQGGAGGVANNNILIDAANPAWAPLQPNDTFKIKAGDYDNVELKNLAAANGEIINVFPLDGLVHLNELKISGENAVNLNINFYNKINGLTKAALIDSQYQGEVVRMNESGSGNFKLSIKGFITKNTFNRSWRNISETIPYLGGTGKVSIQLLDVQYCEWRNDPGINLSADGIVLGGSYNPAEDQDQGFVKMFIWKNNIVENCDFEIAAGNLLEGYLSDSKIIGVYPTATHHARIINIYGAITAERISGVDHYGNMIRIVPLRRIANPKNSIIRNCTGLRSRKYSLAEVNQYEAQLRFAPGVMELGSVKFLGISTKDMGTGNTYTSTCVDNFSGDQNGKDVTIKNCVSVNPHIDGGGAVTVVNGPAQFVSNNFAYANNNLTKMDLITLKPAADSVLKGLGVYDADLLEDFAGVTRLNPPTVGAFEAI